MTESERNQDFTRRVRAALDSSADNLDAETLAELRRVRREVLDRSAPSAPSRRQTHRFLGEWPVWLVPASAFTTLALAALVVSLWVHQPPDHPLPELEDLDLLTSVEALEFFENLEFYQWLPEADRAG